MILFEYHNIRYKRTHNNKEFLYQMFKSIDACIWGPWFDSLFPQYRLYKKKKKKTHNKLNLIKISKCS